MSKQTHGSRVSRPVRETDIKREIKIPVQDLREGMFVCGLDRDWLETPFALQGFYVRTREDIEQVRKYCRYVYVIGTGRLQITETVNFESGELIGRKPEHYPISGKAEQEWPSVKAISSKARVFVRGMLDDVRLGQSVDSPAARVLVEESVDSVIRHPDAMAFATKLRGQDEYTAEHCMNVCMLAIIFGRKLGLRKQQLVNLGLCGLLHDAGKARIPTEILNKPGRLTDEEFALMKRHSEYGRDLLSEKKDMYHEAIEVAYAHHERPNGTGYPRGLQDEHISLFTRIIAIVDCYDAITNDRVYAKGRPVSEALRILYEQRGEQFDDKLVLAFIQTIGIYHPGMLVELVNGMVAVVVDSAHGPRHLPRILLLLNRDKQPVRERFLDLNTFIQNDLGRNFLIKRTLPDGCYGLQLAELVERKLFSVAARAAKLTRPGSESN